MQKQICQILFTGETCEKSSMVEKGMLCSEACSPLFSQKEVPFKKVACEVKCQVEDSDGNWLFVQ